MRRKVPLNWISFWTSSFLQPFNFFSSRLFVRWLIEFFFLFVHFILSFTIKWKKILFCNSIISPTESIVLTKHFFIWQKKKKTIGRKSIIKYLIPLQIWFSSQLNFAFLQHLIFFFLRKKIFETQIYRLTVSTWI